MNISEEAQELYEFMQNEYIRCGYLFSASWPWLSLLHKGYSRESIKELCDVGVLQKRDCEEYAFELTPSERKTLISTHDLRNKWKEQGGELFDMGREIESVSQ